MLVFFLISDLNIYMFYTLNLYRVWLLHPHIWLLHPQFWLIWLILPWFGSFIHYLWRLVKTSLWQLTFFRDVFPSSTQSWMKATAVWPNHSRFRLLFLELTSSNMFRDGEQEMHSIFQKQNKAQKGKQNADVSKHVQNMSKIAFDFSKTKQKN